MLRLVAALGLLAILLSAVPANAQIEPTCSDFDAWVWAQTVFDEAPIAYPAMDPDGDGVACPTLPLWGFAPVQWTNAIPTSAEAAQVTGVVDGDTFDVTVNGTPDRVRLYHINAPETSFEQHCGGDSATAFLAFILQWAPNGTVYLEYDQTQRDDFDRRLAYVWYELAGDVYLVNEAMVRSGYAESRTYRPDDKYKEQLDRAEEFSVRHVLGVRAECGRFGQPPGTEPSDQQKREACNTQPQQGQLAWTCPYVPGGQQPTEPTPPPQQPDPPAQQPPQEDPPAPPPSGNCDPSYPTVCIPPRSQVGDLDCGDIGYRRFTVLQPDPHNFDGDYDGVGCESG